MSTDPKDKLSYDRMLLAHSLLNTLGIPTPALTEPVTEQAASEENIESTATPPIPATSPAEEPPAVEILPTLAAPVITETPLVSAQTEEGEQTQVTFTSMFAGNDDVPAESVGTPQAASRKLSDEEQIALMYKRDDAAKDARRSLLYAADVYLKEAQKQGFDRFESHISFNKPGFPIQLTFSKEVEEKGKKKIAKLHYSLDKYEKFYTDRGIAVTLGEAVAFTGIVQRLILDAEGINSATKAATVRTEGLRDLDRYLPFPIEEWRVVSNSGGSYSLELEGKEPSARVGKTVKLSIPLGLAVRNPNDKAEINERDAREEYVLELIQNIEKATGAPKNSKCFIQKRHILGAYKAWLEQEGKEWVSAERMPLSQPDDEAAFAGGISFDKNNLLYVSPTGRQKITLAPVTLHMDVGGKNPSWHATFRFHLGDKNIASMGELIRTRDLNLHTRNPELAIARTWESLLGIRSPRNGNTETAGLLQQLQNLATATKQEWHVENKDTPAEKIVVCRMQEDTLKDCIDAYNNRIRSAYPLHDVPEAVKQANKAQLENKLIHKILRPQPDQNGVVTLELQHMLDDMIRYEKDLGVEPAYEKGPDGPRIAKSAPDKDGNIHITIHATRSNTGDRRRTLRPRPEYVYDGENNNRMPIAYSIPVPASEESKIPDFIKAVREDIHEFAQKSASAVLQTNDKPDIRRTPVEYRAAQARNGLKRAIEKLYSHVDYFAGHPLPKDWSTPKMQAQYAPLPKAEEPVTNGQTGFADTVNKKNLAPGSNYLA